MWLMMVVLKYIEKEYIEECPEDSGTKWNYASLKYIRDKLKKERYNMSICKEELNEA